MATKKMYKQILSVHGSSVLTVKLVNFSVSLNQDIVWSCVIIEYTNL